MKLSSVVLVKWHNNSFVNYGPQFDSVIRLTRLRRTVLATGLPHKQEHVGANPTAATIINGFVMASTIINSKVKLIVHEFDSRLIH